MIQLALIGVGNWGRKYIEVLKRNPKCRLKYVCAETSESLQALEGEYIKTTDYAELFSYNDIDGVIIATPISTHYKIAADFLKRGFTVLVEKPVTTSIKNAVSLQKICEQKKSICMVNHIYLYNPAFNEVKKLARNSGDIKYIDLEGSNWGPFRKDASALWDWSPHDISMTIELMGMPTLVQSWAVTINSSNKQKMYDMIYTKLQFEKNIAAFIKNGTLSLNKTRSLTIVGTKKSIFYDELSDKKISVFIKGTQDLTKNSSTTTYPPYSNKSALDLVIEAFISSIKNKKQPYSDIIKAVQIVRVIDAIERSVESGGKKIMLVNSKK